MPAEQVLDLLEGARRAAELHESQARQAETEARRLRRIATNSRSRYERLLLEHNGQLTMPFPI